MSDGVNRLLELERSIEQGSRILHKRPGFPKRRRVRRDAFENEEKVIEEAPLWYAGFDLLAMANTKCGIARSIRSDKDITEAVAEKIQKRMVNKYDENTYHCVHHVTNYVSGCIYDEVYYPGKILNPKISKDRKLMGNVIYNIMGKPPPKEFTPPKQGDVKGPNGRLLGQVDRLKFYDNKGWYVERGRPDDETSYRLVYTSQGVPLQIKSGDRLYTAQGYNKSKTGYDLRHESFVVIKGNKISLWGSWNRSKGPEERGTDVMYLKVRELRKNKPYYDRRIVIRVRRPDYRKNNP